MITKSLLVSTAFIALFSLSANADEYTYSPQLSQIKLDKAIQTYANNGKGITIAIVDTGINANHNEVSGRVSSSSTCVATGNCGQGIQDTNFHGTFVASIAAGSQNGYGMVGVAPLATILAVKIAQPSGSAMTNDENAGLLAAAQRGAQVINLSYGSFFGPSTTSGYAYYNASLVSTLNAVAAKGSTTVIAGGNSSKTFMDNVNQGGFTSATLSRMLFVGSVNSSNTLSSFSNTPGSTQFTTTDGKTVALSSMWLMAPGENLIGAYYGGNTSYVSASGTSFSAPQVTGAVALLESRWPVLYKNGTAAKVLLTTATDLGAKGVDNVYGAGLMNVNQAFLPVGSLNITNSKGASVNVTQITGSMLSSGAFGSLSTIKTKLSNMSAFDSFSRDYSINLSSLIATKPTAATVALPHGSQVVGSSYKFAEGGALSFGQTVSTSLSSSDDNPLNEVPKNFYLSMLDSEGAMTSAGYGFSVSPSFTEALWGSSFADGIQKLDLSNGLLSIAQGGAFMSYGEQLSPTVRYALSWSQTASSDDFLTTTSMDETSATGVGFGMTKDLSPTWKAGFTVNLLDEKNQWMGATYANSPIGFGEHHKSTSLGISTAYQINEDSQFVFDAAVSRGNGQNVESSLIESVSDVYAESMGVAYNQNNSFEKGDKFSVSIKQPMRIFTGSANVAYSSVDEDGNPVISSEQVSLKPDGHEIDLAIGYTSALKDDTQWSANLTARHDDGNVQGQDSVGFMISTKRTF